MIIEMNCVFFMEIYADFSYFASMAPPKFPNFFSWHTYHTFLFFNTIYYLFSSPNTFSVSNFRLCWTWWESQTGQNGYLAHELCVHVHGTCAVWLTVGFSPISPVRHGPAVATCVNATVIPWVPSVTLSSAPRCQVPPAVSLDKSWSTRQSAAAQTSRVVSNSHADADIILIALRPVSQPFSPWKRVNTINLRLMVTKQL